MRALSLFSVVLVVSLLSCKSHKALPPPDAKEASELPQSAALQKLREMLPTADYVYCTAPKWSLKPADISNWTVETDAISIDHGKGNRLRLAFADITDVRLDQSGKYFYVKVHSLVQSDRDKAHFEFLFRSEDRSKQVAELLLSQKKK
jgi:hypothetical protein